MPPAARGIADLLLGVDHVGVAVADLDSALTWWSGALGLQETHREENLGQQVVEVMLAGPPGDDEWATQVQVLAPLDPGSAVARFLDRHGPGLQHLALAVSDLAAACVRLAETGVVPLYSQGSPGTSGSTINFLHPRDTGGVLVELVEPPAASLSFAQKTGTVGHR